MKRKKEEFRESFKSIGKSREGSDLLCEDASGGDYLHSLYLLLKAQSEREVHATSSPSFVHLIDYFPGKRVSAATPELHIDRRRTYQVAREWRGTAGRAPTKTGTGPGDILTSRLGDSVNIPELSLEEVFDVADELTTRFKSQQEFEDWLEKD